MKFFLVRQLGDEPMIFNFYSLGAANGQLKKCDEHWDVCPPVSQTCWRTGACWRVRQHRQTTRWSRSRRPNCRKLV